MANPQVEKLKALGIRHGEKAVVGLSTLLCLWFLFQASTKPTIDITADQVATAAKQASSSLDAKQNVDDILQKLEAQGIKEIGFEKVVDAQSKQALVASAYKIARPWIIPEPGAGLIRDAPELIAPTELYAYPGRGGALVFALDEDGNRIPEEEKTIPEPVKKRRKKKRRAARARWVA